MKGGLYPSLNREAWARCTLSFTTLWTTNRDIYTAEFGEAKDILCAIASIHIKYSITKGCYDY